MANLSNLDTCACEMPISSATSTCVLPSKNLLLIIIFSLQEPAYSENTENIYLMDQIGDKKNTDELWTQNLTIEEAMKRLNDKEKMIINKRFFEGRTQVEVAEEIGISQAQVSRLERLAIGHIKRIYK